MLAALLLAAVAGPAGAEAAERAFAAQARRDGQWTAFRAFAAAEALMFVPEPANAQGWLAGRANPEVAIARSPSRIFTACDGSLAVSTGPWTRGQAHGTFTTIWRRQYGGGWKWVFDHSRDTARAVASVRQPTVTAPVCTDASGDPAPAPAGFHVKKARVNLPLAIEAFGAPEILVQHDGAMPAQDSAGLPSVKIGDAIAHGCSDDGSLCWESVGIDAADTGAHDLAVFQRRESGSQMVLYDLAGVPAA